MSFKEFRFGKMPTHWESKRIIDYTEIVTDYVANGSFASLKENVTYFEDPNYAVLIRLTDYNRGFDGQFVYIDEHAYNFLSKTQLFGGEIIISNVGANVGTVFKVPYLRKKMNLGPNSIMVKTKGNDDFYFYWFSSPNGQESIKSILSGSAQPKFNKTSFRNLELPIPPYKEQNAIAHILSTLDDKIEVNNEINKTLENMAQAIFKQWFVDFEFPNEDGEPYKSSGGEMVESELGMIPKGWEVVQFRDIFRFVKGKKPKTIAECEFKDSEKYLTIDVLNRNSVLFCSKEKVIEANSEDVLMVMDGASSGAVYFGQKGVVASTLAKLELISQKVSNQFLFYAIKYFENDIKTHTTGSAIPHTDKEYTYRLMIALPNDISLQTKIDDLLCDISDTFIAREQENAVLKATRDTLLPKLMSGEIRVPLDEEGGAS